MQRQEPKKTPNSPKQTRANVICLIDQQIKSKICSCTYHYSSWQDAHDHVTITHVRDTTFVCPQCTKSYTNAHDALSCSLTDTQKNFFSCVCKTVYYTYNTLLRHAARCKTISKEKKIIPILPKPSPAHINKKQNNQPIFMAPTNEQAITANYTTTRQASLDTQRTWYSYKPRQPKIIDPEKKSYAEKNPELYEKALIGLAHHIDKKIKNHYCCEEQFTSWDHGCSHIRNCHKLEKRQFECPSCKEMYKDPAHTLSCLIYHTAPDFFECPFCHIKAPIKNRAKLHFHLHYKCSLEMAMATATLASSQDVLHILADTNTPDVYPTNNNNCKAIYEHTLSNEHSFLGLDTHGLDNEQHTVETSQPATYQEYWQPINYHLLDESFDEFNFLLTADVYEEKTHPDVLINTNVNVGELNTPQANEQNHLELPLFFDSPSNAHH